MGELSDLPPELVLDIVSFLTRKIIIDKDNSCTISTRLSADPNVYCFRDAIVPLTATAGSGNLSIARMLPGAGADMHNALQHCSIIEMFCFFLESGADPNAEYGGSTPLHAACLKQDAQFAKASVKVLLQFGAAAVEKADRRGLTPLDIAIGRGLNDIVEAFKPLVQDGDCDEATEHYFSSVDQVWEIRSTALSLSTFMPVLAELPPELLLHIIGFLTRDIILDTDILPGYYKSEEPESLPDVSSINALSRTNSIFYRTLNRSLYDVCASIEPALGKLALLFAVQHQSESAVEKLVAAGVDLDSEFYFQYNACSVLHIAAGMGHRTMVVKLLAMHGAEMKERVHARRGLNRWTALDYAARLGHLEITRILAPIPWPGPRVDGGPPADPDPVQAHREYLSVALIHSVRAEKTEVSEYLVSEGADVFKSLNGTPLYHAAATKNVGLVQFLLAAGVDPNRHDNDFIPLFNATCLRNLDVVQALLLGGADIHVKNRNSLNVLSCCTDVESLRFFLERGVDPNLAEPSGDTPLHHACGAEEAEFAQASVELLLEFGAATVDKPGRRGFTPVDIAIREGYTEIVELLEPLVQNPELKIKIASWWEET
ncbi:ankyrin repeat-containing domain protein [Mycena sanguinolenta]|nr:ankyrin repeat-containing domain protein [Mycena sanguinolenta]